MQTSRAKQEQRKKEFKKGIDSEESRRKREETAVEIRKTKRDQGLLQKRRNMGPSQTQQSQNSQNETPATISGLQQYVAYVTGQNPQQWVEGTIAFRKLLSIERNPPIQEVIETGVIPRFVQFLTFPNVPKLQFEAAWALTNIASGTSQQTQVLLSNGAVGVFIQLLASPDEELKEQAVWALGNIAGDSPKCRDFVLNAGALQPMLGILAQPHNKQSMLRNATWGLSNLCRGKPQPNFNLVAPCLPTLGRLIHSSDPEVIIDACWALSYLSDGQDSNIQAVLNAGVAQRLVELLTHSLHTIQTPALRTVGNIVTGNDEQTQKMLDLGILPIILQLLQNSRKAIRKEAAWAISNITAGNKEQTNAVIAANIMPAIVYLLNHGEFDVKKECAWAISNATTWKIPAQIHHLVQCGCIKPLCDLLKSNDNKIIGVCLEALDNVLSIGELNAKNGGTNPYVAIVEEADGIDRLEELQDHVNEDIYERAMKMLESYFGGEEEDENLAPNVSQTQGVYSFGSNFQAPSGPFVF